MKILVFGAGVLGYNLARNFFRAGKDVTLLARGAWGESIPKNGLRIKDKFSPRMSVSRIPVTAELKAEDKYDVIFVVLRYTQLDAILDALRTNPTKNIVFVGNDMRASALSASLPEKNVMFAFASSAGHREREYVASVDLKKLKGNTAYLSRLIDANIEGYRAIKNARHEILPKDNVEFEGAAYHKTCLCFFKLMSATSLGKICASYHAMNAVDEMSALNRDLKAFFDENGAKYSVWQELEQEVAKYLKCTKGKCLSLGGRFFCPLTEKSDSGEASVNFSTDIAKADDP